MANTPNQKGSLETLSRSGRTLRTPTFEIQSGDVRFRVRGDVYVFACVDSHRLVAGPLHGETVKGFLGGDRSEWRWVSLPLGRYRGHRVHLEFTAPPEQPLDVQLGIEGPEPSRDSRMEVDIPPVHDAMLKAVSEGIEGWRAGTPCPPEEAAVRARMVFGALYFLKGSPEFVEQWTARMRDWRTQRDELKAGLSKAPALAPAMLDGSGEDDRLLIRGNSATPGDVVSRRFLESIGGASPLPVPTGSGRLQLAERIVDPANPLTTRVMVNRLWHHLMGRGIVPTVDDFGVLGQRPTHPELLDFLATEFRKDGQSIKRMIRRIVLSQTYRMSGEGDAKAVEADPKNELWHHRPPKRLEGEVIRDSLLAISGRLDRTQFGPSVKVHLTTFMEGRGRPPQSGPMDGAGRRSIYLEVRRNFLSPFMLTFDTPNPFSTMGRRNSSNVPAQALILMNDPFVRECAESWAKRAIAEGPADGDERIAWFYRTAFGRRPTEQEARLLRGFLPSDGEVNKDLSSWTDIAHAIINTKEFVFIP